MILSLSLSLKDDDVNGNDFNLSQGERDAGPVVDRQVDEADLYRGRVHVDLQQQDLDIEEHNHDGDGDDDVNCNGDDDNDKIFNYLGRCSKFQEW